MLRHSYLSDRAFFERNATREYRIREIRTNEIRQFSTPNEATRLVALGYWYLALVRRSISKKYFFIRADLMPSASLSYFDRDDFAKDLNQLKNGVAIVGISPLEFLLPSEIF